MSTIDIDLNSICQQRKRALLYTVPPTRYNPENIYTKYPQFTKYQFDMRRKAEILSYNPSASSTQTNNITKREKFVNIMKGINANKDGSYQDIVLNQTDICGNYSTLIVKYPDSYITEQVLVSNDICLNPIYRTVYNVIPNGRLKPVCNTDLIPQPTSSSNVPGPIMYLIKDPDVPLYNYSLKTNAYGIINSKPLDPWVTFTEEDIVFNNSIMNKLFTLSIQSTINDYAYNFDFKTPIYLFFNGSPNVAFSDITRTITNKISISDITLNVLYNNDDVKSTKSISITPKSHFSTTEFNIELVEGSTILPFSGGIYLGMLYVSNLYLYTQPGYIYDINLTITLSFINIDGFYSSYFNNISRGVYCNSKKINKLQNNCSIATPSSIEGNTGFSFSGL